MNRDMLSQDEIDALLKQNNLESNKDVSHDQESERTVQLDDFISAFEQDAIGEISNISFGSASTALSSLLGLKVDITTPTLILVKRENLHEYFPSPHVAIHVQYTKGFKGINLFVMKADDAKVIADLMLGGTGEEVKAGELNDMDISAVQEAMNQMMGSAATSMSTIFNTPVNISPPGVDILNISNGKGEEKIPDDVMILVSFKLKVGTLIDSNIMQLVSIPFAKELVSKLLGTEEEDEQIKENVQEEKLYKEEVAATMVENKETNVRIENVSATNGGPNNYQELSKSVNPNVNVQKAQFGNFNFPDDNNRLLDPNLGLLMDIPLQITVELGRTKKLIKDILELSQGSIIELDKLAGEPVDIFANNKLIAKGEVVVIDENFGVRITDIISQYDRVKKLQ